VQNEKQKHVCSEIEMPFFITFQKHNGIYVTLFCIVWSTFPMKTTKSLLHKKAQGNLLAGVHAGYCQQKLCHSLFNLIKAYNFNSMFQNFKMDFYLTNSSYIPKKHIIFL
jgi:hypothetical protein